MHNHAERFSVALTHSRTLRAAQTREVARRWEALLLLLTSSEGLWEAHGGHLDYTSGTAELPELPYLNTRDRLLLGVGRNLFAGSDPVALTDYCMILDDRGFALVMAAIRLVRGEKDATLDLWNPFHPRHGL